MIYFNERISTDHLIVAWQQLKYNPGRLAKGTTESTLNSIDMKWFKEANELLREGKFIDLTE